MIEITDELVLKYSDILKSEIDPDKITSRYVIIRVGATFSSGYVKRICECVNLMAKYGWKPIAWTGNFCMMVREE